MQINTCKNNKFIFYKMVHDKIYHDLIMPMLCNQVVVKQATHLTTKRVAVCCEMGRSRFKMGSIVKWVGTAA